MAILLHYNVLHLTVLCWILSLQMLKSISTRSSNLFISLNENSLFSDLMFFMVVYLFMKAHQNYISSLNMSPAFQAFIQVTMPSLLRYLLGISNFSCPKQKSIYLLLSILHLSKWLHHSFIC